MMKSFAIVGAGAVGSYYGARLAAAGHDVRFLLRADYDEVSRNGLEVKSIHGNVELPEVDCYRTSEEIGKVDVVIVAWKSTANHYSEKVIGPLMRDDTIVLTLQNGMGNVEVLGALFGPERILGGMCFVCINRMKAGVIHHVGGGLVAIGEMIPSGGERLPILIPRGFVVGGGVILGWFFADPKDGGGNELLPVIEGFLVFEGVRGRRHDRHLGPVLGRGGGDQERGEDDGERSQVGGIYHSERKFPVFQGFKV